MFSFRRINCFSKARILIFKCLDVPRTSVWAQTEIVRSKWKFHLLTGIVQLKRYKGALILYQSAM